MLCSCWLLEVLLVVSEVLDRGEGSVQWVLDYLEVVVLLEDVFCAVGIDVRWVLWNVNWFVDLDFFWFDS